MINSIREVRRARGLTLAEVAQRCVPPTTAQTIGRLETGTRTLSLDWLNRIAAALEVESRALVRTGDEPELPVTARLTAAGAEALSRAEKSHVPRPGSSTLVLDVVTSQGDYRTGDRVWLNQLPPERAQEAMNRDVLVPRSGGRFVFGRMIGLEDGRVLVLPPGAGQRQQVVSAPAWLGVAETLIRSL